MALALSLDITIQTPHPSLIEDDEASETVKEYTPPNIPEFQAVSSEEENLNFYSLEEGK